MLNILIKEKRYSDKLILENIQVSIPQNGLYGVVGKNGVGKTTFFKCLCSLTPFKGEISYQQQPLTPQQIGFLPTEPYLYEHLTVEEFYKLYIFDEPFSGLDITSVLQIKKLLKKLSETHIVLFASHILETLSDCKEIYLLHEGAVKTFLPSELNEIEDFFV